MPITAISHSVYQNMQMFISGKLWSLLILDLRLLSQPQKRLIEWSLTSHLTHKYWTLSFFQEVSCSEPTAWLMPNCTAWYLGPDLQKILRLCYDNIYVKIMLWQSKDIVTIWSNLQKKSYNNLKIKLQQRMRYNYDHKIDVLNINNNNENGEC